MSPIIRALDIALQSGTVDGSHHKMWVIDQMVRALCGCPVEARTGTSGGTRYSYEVQGTNEAYDTFVRRHNRPGGGDEDEYEWDVGIPP